MPRITRGRLAIIIVLLGLALLITWRFRAQASITQPASIESVQADRGLPIETVAATPRSLSLWRTVAGTVVGLQQSSIMSTNTLEIVALPFAEGDDVETGETVVMLAETAPNPMLHSLARSRALYEDAQRDVERLRNLYDEGAISRQELDKAETQLQIALADMANARDGIELKAPHSGTITSLPVEVGDMAKANKALAWVASTDSVRVVFEAGSRQALSLALGQPCRWLNPDTGVYFEGVVSKLALSANPTTHLRRGEATFSNPSHRLLPGLLVSIDVRIGLSEDHPVVPAACIVNHDDAPHVFVVENEHAVLKPVTLTLRSRDEVSLGGLKSGEQVVRHGQATVKDGDLVWVVADGEVQR